MWGEDIRAIGEDASRFELRDLSFQFGFDSCRLFRISLYLDICEVGIDYGSIHFGDRLGIRTCIARYWGGWYGLDPCRLELTVEVADRVAILEFEPVCLEGFEASSEFMVSDLLLEITDISRLSSL